MLRAVEFAAASGSVTRRAARVPAGFRAWVEAKRPSACIVTMAGGQCEAWVVRVQGKDACLAVRVCSGCSRPCPAVCLCGHEQE